MLTLVCVSCVGASSSSSSSSVAFFSFHHPHFDRSQLRVAGNVAQFPRVVRQLRAARKALAAATSVTNPTPVTLPPVTLASLLSRVAALGPRTQNLLTQALPHVSGGYAVLAAAIQRHLDAAHARGSDDRAAAAGCGVDAAATDAAGAQAATTTTTTTTPAVTATAASAAASAAAPKSRSHARARVGSLTSPDADAPLSAFDAGALLALTGWRLRQPGGEPRTLVCSVCARSRPLPDGRHAAATAMEQPPPRPSKRRRLADTTQGASTTSAGGEASTSCGGGVGVGSGGGGGGTDGGTDGEGASEALESGCAGTPSSPAPRSFREAMAAVAAASAACDGVFDVFDEHRWFCPWSAAVHPLGMCFSCTVCWVCASGVTHACVPLAVQPLSSLPALTPQRRVQKMPLPP